VGESTVDLNAPFDFNAFSTFDPAFDFSPLINIGGLESTFGTGVDPSSSSQNTSPSDTELSNIFCCLRSHRGRRSGGCGVESIPNLERAFLHVSREHGDLQIPEQVEILQAALEQDSKPFIKSALLAVAENGHKS